MTKEKKLLTKTKTETENLEQGLTIKVKYFDKDYPVLLKTERGDRVDLRVSTIEGIEIITESGDTKKVSKDEIKKINEDFKKTGVFTYKRNEIITFGLGVAMELPEKYEAVLSPRSSAFKHWGFTQTNSFGVIDESYKGDGDLWKVQMLANRNGKIERFSRVVQFKAQKKMEDTNFLRVKELKNEDRGGFGTSGRK